MQTTIKIAKDLIEYYVLRGDTLESLRAGRQGSYSKESAACIGGYIENKKINPDKIIVSRINGKDIAPEIFSLKKLFNDILEEKIKKQFGQQKLI